MAKGHGTHHYKPGEVAWGAEHHILPVSVYRNTILALFVLMGATIGASFLPIPDVIRLGPVVVYGTLINNIIALTIAIVKASLVVLFFMHVRYATKLTKFWAITGFLWFLLMFFILVDYGTRPLDTSIVEPWNSDPGSALPKYPKESTSEQVDPRYNINVRPRQ